MRRTKPVAFAVSLLVSQLAWARGQQPPEPDDDQQADPKLKDREDPPPDDAPTGAEQPEAREEQEALEARVAELEAQVAALGEKLEEDELERIVAEAEAVAVAPEEDEKPEERTFLWGALALQKLNPEISINGDFVAQLVIDDGHFYAGEDDRSQLGLRNAGLHFQHVLDPYSMFKASIEFSPFPHPHVGLEEMYMTWFGVIPSVSFGLGRFRQNFGVLNRWHEHDLDQVNHPLAMTQVLGEHGLNQTGLVFKWFMPRLWAHANELVIEVTNAENDTLFAGEFFSTPASLAHLKNYWDLTESTYLELGLSGMHGTNNRRGYVSGDGLYDEPWRHTAVAGADLTVQWSPPEKARYRSLTWRSEGYFVWKQTKDEGSIDFQADFDAGVAERDGDRISWGAYSYLDYQLATRWFAGVRGDVVLPTRRSQDELAWDVVPYITFWQSEFVYLRLEYRHGQKIPFEQPGRPLGLRTDNRVLLQVDWAAGPHKHEKY